jgi:gliding motility-associated-like protein
MGYFKTNRINQKSRAKGLLFRVLVFLIVTGFSMSSSFATHIVGGEIFYECLGGDQYRVTLHLYRDCILGEAEFDDPATITVFNSSGAIFTTLYPNFAGANVLEVEVDNPCLQVSPIVCVDHAVYESEVSLPFLAGGYQVVYQRCCRNNSILNLSNPQDAGATYYLNISELALNTCNGSPQFDEFPPVALCADNPLFFDQSATDPDGDLLVYSLCDPFHGASPAIPAPDPDSPPPYQFVTWAPGFSSANPMNANTALAIDPLTGELTGTPTQIGQYVVGVCVEEYRDGILLGVNKRDLQFNVVTCESNVEAIIADFSPSFDPCDGLEVSFESQSINGELFAWDFGVSGIETDVSSEEFPSYTYPDSGTYTVLLIANPGYPCAHEDEQDVTVHRPITAEITPVVSQCADSNSFDFEVTGQFGGGAEFLWDFGPLTTPSASTDQFPTGISFSELGEIQISVTVSEPVCDDSDEETVITLVRPLASIALQEYVGCDPLTIEFEDQSQASTPLQYLWDLGNGVQSVHQEPYNIYDSAGVYDLSLTVWTSSGCVDTSYLLLPGAITVNPSPNSKFNCWPEEASIFEPHFSFEGLTDSIVACWLAFGEGEELTGILPECEFEYSYSDTGWYFPKYFVENEFGCIDSTALRLRVYPEYRMWIPNSFTPNGDGVNDTFKPNFIGVKKYGFRIFDRWGRTVFYTDNNEVAWDGKVGESNHVSHMNVFAYEILAVDVHGVQHNLFGHVTLYRN